MRIAVQSPRKRDQLYAAFALRIRLLALTLAALAPPAPLSLAPGLKPSGSNLVLNCTDDCRENGAPSATGDDLRDNAANTQIARLSSSHNRREQ